MKRSQALIKLQKFYAIRHIMVEKNYITPKDFCEEILKVIEGLGMQPPKTENGYSPNHISWMKAQGYHPDGTPLEEVFVERNNEWEPE